VRGNDNSDTEETNMRLQASSFNIAAPRSGTYSHDGIGRGTLAVLGSPRAFAKSLALKYHSTKETHERVVN
jgi:hypothetical protein